MISGMPPARPNRESIQTWRPHVLSRIASVLTACAFSFAGFCFIAGWVTLEPPTSRLVTWIWGLSFIGLPITLACLVVFRFRLALYEDEIEVRNIGTRHIALRDVESATPGSWGLVIIRRQAPDSAVIAVGVQKSNIAVWLKWKTRADNATEVIMARAAQATRKGPLGVDMRKVV